MQNHGKETTELGGVKKHASITHQKHIWGHNTEALETTGRTEAAMHVIPICGKAHRRPGRGQCATASTRKTQLVGEKTICTRRSTKIGSGALVSLLAC